MQGFSFKNHLATHLGAFLLGPGRFVIHNPFGNPLGKASDPYINKYTLRRLMNHEDRKVRQTAIANLIARGDLAFVIYHHLSFEQTTRTSFHILTGGPVSRASHTLPTEYKNKARAMIATKLAGDIKDYHGERLQIISLELRMEKVFKTALVDDYNWGSGQFMAYPSEVKVAKIGEKHFLHSCEIKGHGTLFFYDQLLYEVT